MIQTLLVTVASLIGSGGWNCEYSYKYPEHNLSETFYSTIYYSEDLKFTAKTEIFYSRIDSPEVIGKVVSISNGATISHGETFTHVPKEVSVNLVFDDFNGLSEKYIDYLREYLSKPGKNLKVQSIDSSNMEILHLESGTITKCAKYIEGLKS